MAYNPKKAKLLPKKLSDCLALAIKDLEMTVATPGYLVNMDEWYVPSYIVAKKPKVCTVCFAGGLIAGTLGADHLTTRNLNPDDFVLHNRNRLYAMNSVRGGNVVDAITDLHRKPNHDIPYESPAYKRDYDAVLTAFNGNEDVGVVDFDEEDPKPFFRDMRKIQKKLAKAGV